jgi:isopentenyldiphosphate isomerase
MADELLDIFDEAERNIGVASKGLAHRLGLWHYAIHCWLYRVVTDPPDVRLLFQQRGAGKQVYPGLFDISAAGHYRVGEAAEDGVREVSEELGIEVDFRDLTYLGTRAEVFEIDDLVTREFCRMFLGRTTLPPAAMRPGQPEVTALVEIPLAEGLAMCSGTSATAGCSGVRYDSGTWHGFESRISLRDLVPRPDSYYLGIFQLVDRVSRGKPAWPDGRSWL